MKTFKALIVSFGVLAVATACSQDKDENPAGAWTSAAPTTVTDKIEGATQAVKTITIDFAKGDTDAAGTVVYTADYDVTVPYVTDSVTNSNKYQVKASVSGTWTSVKSDDDEYTLSFDTNTLEVNGVNAPELGTVTDDFLASLTPLTYIEDVKVNKDRTGMTFEAGKPEVKYVFVAK